MLDDLKFIHNRDSQDALGVAAKQWQQLEQVYQTELRISGTVENVVVAGMGGSALAASFVPTWPGISVPFQICRDYAAPGFVSASTLFIASSYSGNTEETLSALAEAEKKNAQIVVIASGGALQERAQEKGYPFYQLPGEFQPRMAVFYNFAALVQLLEAAGPVANGSVDELHKTAALLKQKGAEWLPDIPTARNQAKQIALDLVGKSPVIYGSPLLFPAAYKWKINCNENAKNVAWCNQLPEFNHNEFLGWTSHPVDKPYAPVFLQSSFDHPQITKRFEVSKRLLSGRMPEPQIIQAQGETILEQLLWTVTLGDFVSLYLALLNNIDPTPVDLIEKLKKELA